MSALLLGALTCHPVRAGVVEFTDRREWETAVKHFTAVRYTTDPLKKNVPLDVGLVTVVATGTGNAGAGRAKDGTLSLHGSGTTAPWFRHTIKIKGGKVCAIGWDWSHSGHPRFYQSELIHDGGKIRKVWPAEKKGFLGYVDTKGKTISGFWFGTVRRCNFTGGGIENICLSNLQPPPGIDSVPPEWAAFDIHFKETWEQTLAANPEQQWRKELSDTGSLPPALKGYVAENSDATRFIVGLRRITLLKAMIERFPDERAKQTQAYKTISQTSREIVLPWWPNSGTSPFGKLKPIGREFELTTRWEALLGAFRLHGPKHPIHPENVQNVLDLANRTDARFELSPSHHVSYRFALDGLLGDLSPEQLDPLRNAQDEAVRYLAKEARRTADFDEAARLAHNAPWARSMHTLLVDLGEQALRQGRRQWALASFEDVLTHASDPQIRLAARVGQWVALASQTGGRGSLARAMAAVPDNTPMPWHGGKIAAGQLKKALLAANAPRAVKLADLPRRQIQLPQSWPADEQRSDGPLLDFGLHTPWPVSQVQAAGGAVFVFSPARAARFNLDGSGPVWTHAPAEIPAAASGDPAAAARYIKNLPEGTGFDRRPVIARSDKSPAVSADGRIIYCLAASAKQAAVALDAATGRQRWSTRSIDGWRNLVPMSRPVVADGRVYVLAIPTGKASGKKPPPQVGWQLVCMDGRSGCVLWARILGWQPYTVLDIARGSSGVTVRNGSVYCATDMGLVARCDARDGAVDWVRGYASAVDRDPRSETFCREGSCVVAGSTLLVAPRDHSGVLAFRCDTGQYLWETLAIPSDRLIGVSGSAVLTMNQRQLCAIDIGTGRTLWSRQFPKGTGSQGAIVGGDCIVASGGKLHRIAAATGATIETLDLKQTDTSEFVLLDSGMLLEIKAPKPGGGK